MTKIRPLAIVTGGTSGIGLAIAKKLASAYDLAVIYRSDHTKAQKAQNDIEKVNLDCKVITFQCDIRSLAELQSTYKLIADKFKTIPYALVNCAGIASCNLIAMETTPNIENIVQTNFLGTIYMTKLCLHDMYSERRGKIINISSIASEGGYVGMSVYGATKAAVESFSKTIASEVGHRNIQINCIKPALVATSMTSAIENGAEKSRVNLPLGKFIDAEAIAEMAFYLIDNSHGSVINGSVITIDGGSSQYKTQIKLSDFSREPS